VENANYKAPCNNTRQKKYANPQKKSTFFLKSLRESGKRRGSKKRYKQQNRGKNFEDQMERKNSRDH